ncbi:hypothetical protein DH2020_016441 [Rehmannia glutinosa]|uniref:Endonuclease/exonuclease/phosphatase domain-containing protein n=1 Tax=Rehmannia glutinosa TaxID=99300 RepID=A0ABR0WPQ9_REHGL
MEIYRFFYGNPDTSKRKYSWELMRKLVKLWENSNISVVNGGDFNEICSHNEKSGGRRRPETQIDEFNRVIEECELREIYGEGDWFTWVNRRSGEEIIFEKLDRFLSTFNWRLLYPTAKKYTLEYYSSDHRAVGINWRSRGTKHSTNSEARGRKFKFEKFWSIESECSDMVEKGWNINGADTSLAEKMAACKKELQMWADSKFRHLPRCIKNEREKLNHLKHSSRWRQATEDVTNLEAKVEKLTTQEEIFWKQRSRNNWLKHGDKNTPVFPRRKLTNDLMTNTIKDWCPNKGIFVRAIRQWKSRRSQIWKHDAKGQYSVRSGYIMTIGFFSPIRILSV